MAAITAPQHRSSKTESYVDNKRKEDIRHANIVVARSVASAVRTSLGPKGMDKMISTSSDEVIITNDGATILNKMQVLQPAAKMLVELSKSQDSAAGDGTTTIVVWRSPRAVPPPPLPRHPPHRRLRRPPQGCREGRRRSHRHGRPRRAL